MQLEELKTFEPAPAGTHLAILIKLIDLGLQERTFANVTTIKRQATLTWELPNKLNASGRPFVASRTLTLSLHEKATFRSWAESMMGQSFGKHDLFGPKRFNVKSLLGRPCMLKIEHVDREGKISTRVTNLISPPDGISIPTQVNECVYFTLDPDGFNAETFESLSPWTKERIEKSTTYKILRKKHSVTANIPDDDIPF
jgi:hypothetical protein